MSFSQPWCESAGSTESPIVFTPRLSHSGRSRATSPSSVVQTGVKSLGWLKNRPQDDPSHSWKRIRPCVLSASKSGAIWPSWIDMRESPLRPDDGTSRPAEPASVAWGRSEEHTSELQSLLRSAYAVFCLKKKKRKTLDSSQ